ncbi:hypothetical protein BaRGS_00002156, partial [Batillaria attramentaria]
IVYQVPAAPIGRFCNMAAVEDEPTSLRRQRSATHRRERGSRRERGAANDGPRPQAIGEARCRKTGASRHDPVGTCQHARGHSIRDP